MPPSKQTQQLTVFVSYSRRDMIFVDRLVEALEVRGFKCLIDRRDLEYGEKWQGVLRDFIREADTVIFVVSPRSIGSQWCRWELAEVAKISKRLVPIVLEEVPPGDLPPEIGSVHLMPFGTDVDFAAQLEVLEQTMLTDRAWVQEHTHLSGLALKWEAGGRKRDGLLRGVDLGAAESWKQRPTKNGLVPDPLVEAFISDSRADNVRAQRVRTRLTMGVAVGALILSGIAGWQGWRATKNAELAAQRAIEATQQRDIAEQALQREKQERQRADQEASRAFNTLIKGVDQLTEFSDDVIKEIAKRSIPDEPSTRLLKSLEDSYWGLANSSDLSALRRSQIGIVFQRIASTYYKLGDKNNSLRSFSRFVDFSRQLIADDPDNPYWKSTLAAALLRLGNERLANGDKDGQIRDFEEAVNLYEGLVKDPTVEAFELDGFSDGTKLKELSRRNLAIATGMLQDAKARLP